MSTVKTLEQKRAKLCFICVERIRLLKEGRWKELENEIEKKFLPNTLNDFRRFQYYEGAKKEAFYRFLGWFFREEREKYVRRILEKITLSQEERVDRSSENERKKVEEKLKREKLIKYLKEDCHISEIEAELNKNYEEFTKDFESLNYVDGYSSHAKRLSHMIISNGVIPVLAFYKSKEKDRGQIYQDISEMLEVLEFKPYVEWKNQNPNKGLLEFLLDSDAEILRLATTEVLSLAYWLKRIVEAELK